MLQATRSTGAGGRCAAGVLLAAAFCMSAGLTCDPDQVNPGETFCSGGTDVRTIDDSGIPADIKNSIYYDPGPIISKHMPGNPSQANPGFPSGKVVVIPFETPDFPRNTAITGGYLFNIFFASGQLSGISVTQYFLENSWGDFLVTSGGVADWVTLTKNLSSYVGFEGDDDLPRDVLAKANINWSALDANNDKTIAPAEAQIVFVVANGYSAATRGFADYPADWKITDPRPPGMSSLQVKTPSGTFNFKPAVVYIGVKTADDPNFDTDAIRIHSSICHELCHAFFNLVDRYAGPCGTGGTGQYDIMSDNCAWRHMNIHDKMKIGWIQPRIVAGHVGECLAFPASESVPAALVLLDPLKDPLSAQEYWIVENRHKPSSDCDGCVLNLPEFLGFDAAQVGIFDRDLPESGLAVWWVSEGTWYEGHDDVRLVDASLPAQDPDGTTDIFGSDPGYNSQGAGALYKRDDADPEKVLFDGQGQWNLLFFRGVSDIGPTMYAEF